MISLHNFTIPDHTPRSKFSTLNHTWTLKKPSSITFPPNIESLITMVCWCWPVYRVESPCQHLSVVSACPLRKPCYQPPAIRQGVCPKATKCRAKCHLSWVITIHTVYILIQVDWKVYITNEYNIAKTSQFGGIFFCPYPVHVIIENTQI